MINQPLNQFDPDYSVHPGEILEEILEARWIKKQDLAARCEVSAKTISQIIAGQASVTPLLAVKFERVLGVSANIWNNLQSIYNLFQAKLEEKNRLESEVLWAKRFPLRELHKRGYIEDSKPSGKTVGDLLKFFAVSSVSAWKTQWGDHSGAAFRRSKAFKGSMESIAAWLRISEIEAEKVETEPFDKDAFRNALHDVRKQVEHNPEGIKDYIVAGYSAAGVALVFVEELPRTCVSGATRWISPEKAMISVSSRHKTDDHFWFTFFHESGHILLHGKKQIFIECETTESDQDEEEADRFASNLLIPPQKYALLLKGGKFSHEKIKSFADDLGIPPGIVVGRLQHDSRIPYSQLNGLKRQVGMFD